ncbi:MAG: alpha-E domain-containing protein [Myxococcales bacterium]|nr:alpha-E domain-containing protein [Myxococcales bacterium]
MMLARVAESLYWTGRYLERAENVARLLLVTSELAVEMEGIDDKLAQREWDSLVAALPGADRSRLDYSPASGLAVPYVHSLLLDTDNPVSVLRSIDRTRENVRAVREALSVEVFLSLNTTYNELQRRTRRALVDPADAIEIVRSAHARILSIVGAMDHTLSRDEGWNFLKLGEAMERVVRTALVLHAKLPNLMTEDIDLPLVYARWRTLLRGQASLEAFRRAHGAGLEPKEVINFLYFNPAAPRSLRCGLERMKNYLDRLPAATEFTAPERIVGALLAETQYGDEVISRDPHLFLGRVVGELGEAHETLIKQYFEA